MLYTKQKYYEGGSKYSKQLAYKLRKQQSDNAIHKIRDPKTRVIYHQIQEIKDCFKAYYEKLYSQPQVHTDQKMESLLESLNLPKLTEEENKLKPQAALNGPSHPHARQGAPQSRKKRVVAVSTAYNSTSL